MTDLFFWFQASGSLNNQDMDEEESFIDRLSPGMKRVV